MAILKASSFLTRILFLSSLLSIALFGGSPLAWAASSFQQHAGLYEVRAVSVALECTQDQSTPGCVQRGDRIAIRSDAQRAALAVIDPQTRTTRFRIEMEEFDVSGEGRFSTARFSRKDGGAYWSWQSNSRYEFVHLVPETDGYVVLKMRPMIRGRFAGPELMLLLRKVGSR